MKSPTSGLATVTLALATALGVSVAGPHRAYAAPASSAQFEDNLAITVLSPTPHTSFTGDKPIEVSAFYQGSDSNQITSLELYVDGVSAFTKTLAAPEARGVISFLIDTSQMTPGSHAVVVRAVAADAEIVSAKSSFVYVADKPATTEEAAPVTPDTAAAPAQSTLPQLSYLNLSADQKVSGTVKISLKADEADGKSPYVSVFIDRTFKTLRNYAPYEYDWDTTAYTNGYHTIEAYAYDDAQNVGPAQVMRIYVNNPGGRTDVRTDLKDGAPAPKPAPAKPSPRPHVPLDALNAGTPIAHRLTSRTPGLMATRLPATNGINIGDLGLTDPFANANETSAAGSPPRSTKIGARKPMAPAPMRVAKRDVQLTDTLSMSQDLSDPFVTTSGASVGAKSRAMTRRPAPELAQDMSAPHASALRPVMMAKRLDLLDQTGGLHPELQLADPFVPETSSPKPAARAHTPTTGFKPLPSAGSANAPVLAKAQSHAPAITGPEIITRDAHTLPIHLAAPAFMAPTVDVAVLAAKAKPMLVSTTAPVAKATAVKAVAPATHPVKLDVAAPAGFIHHRVMVHTAAPATESLMRAKGQMKVMFNHTALRLDRPITPQGGVMFAPLRQIFEYEGGSLTWDRKTGEVHATSGSKDIRLKIGDNTANVNNKKDKLELAPYLDEGRTMVPLSFLPMALDVNVQFDPKSGHLLISSKE